MATRDTHKWGLVLDLMVLGGQVVPKCHPLGMASDPVSDLAVAFPPT